MLQFILSLMVKLPSEAPKVGSDLDQDAIRFAFSECLFPYITDRESRKAALLTGFKSSMLGT